MLKFLKIVISLLVISFLCAVIGLHIFLNKEGKRLVQAKLEQILRRKVTVGSVHTRFPFDLVVRNVEMKDILTIEEAVVHGGLFDIFSGDFVLRQLSIKHATLNLVKHGEKPPVPPVVSEAKPGEPSAAVEAPKNNSAVTEDNPICLIIPRIMLKKIIVTDSTLNFIDWGVSDEGLKVTLKNVDAQLENIDLPVTNPGVSSFSLRGIIPWENMSESGKVKLEGWVDLFKKDMRASLSMQDIDGLYFYPYFSGWIDAEKTKLSKAKLNFESQISGLNNDVIMDCHLELTDVQMKQREEGQPEDRASKIANVVLGLLKSMNQGKIAIDFKVRTTMDSPKFGFGVIKTAFNTKINECIEAEQLRPSLIKLPARIVGGTFKTAADLTSSLINGTLGIGKAIGGALMSAFTRNEAPAPDQSSGQAKPAAAK